MRIKWRKEGFRDLMTSPKVVADLRDRAERIAAASGEGYVANAEPNPHTRARASVVTTTGKAIRDNQVNNTLIRNLSRGA